VDANSTEELERHRTYLGQQDLLDRLERDLGPVPTREWLSNPMPELGGRTPLELIHSGDPGNRVMVEKLAACRQYRGSSPTRHPLA